MDGAPIRVHGLNHSFGRGELRKQILFDVKVEIEAGEIVIVTGPSGSGKTTLLTLIGALRSAQEGSVRVLGEELHHARPATLENVRRQIGFIFQQHNLLGALTAQQNVELGVRASGRIPAAQRRDRAVAMLQAVGLGERLHHRPEQLSGGQRQRVAIARALASEPAIIMADEPTASLDRQSGRDVVERMRTLAKEHGTTILLVTHDNRILDIADRIVHLEDGRLTTFTDAVISNNRLMMQMLAANHQKRPLSQVVDGLDEHQFRDLLTEITEESERFLEATSLANNQAFRSMLSQGLFAFTRKLGNLLNADRSSLFLVEGDFLELAVAENLEALGEVRFAKGVGIAGLVAETGESVRIDDAYADPRFNPGIDRQTGYRTRSILCLPVKNQRGEVFAVAQLLNRRDGQPFDQQDESRFESFIDSIGVIFETHVRLVGASS